MYKQIEQINKEKGRVRAVLYARCSSDEQKKNGYTVMDQLEFGRHFCKENGIILVGEYVDEGISATLEIKKRKDLANLTGDLASFFSIGIEGKLVLLQSLRSENGKSDAAR